MRNRTVVVVLSEWLASAWASLSANCSEDAFFTASSASWWWSDIAVTIMVFESMKSRILDEKWAKSLRVKRWVRNAVSVAENWKWHFIYVCISFMFQLFCVVVSVLVLHLITWTTKSAEILNSQFLSITSQCRKPLSFFFKQFCCPHQADPTRTTKTRNKSQVNHKSSLITITKFILIALNTSSSAVMSVLSKWLKF